MFTVIISVVSGVCGWMIAKLFLEPVKEILDFRREAQECLIVYGDLSKDRLKMNESQTMAQDEGLALANGLFWYAEKLRFGYDDIQPDQAEALRIYKQAALLSHGKATLRLGEMYEQGIGTGRDAALALARYTEAWRIGVPEGLAGIGGLLFRSGRFTEGKRYWSAFFERICQEKIPESWTDDRVTWVHRYLLLCLTHKQVPHPYPALRFYRSVLLSYHQLSIEHAQDDQHLDILSQLTDWLSTNL